MSEYLGNGYTNIPKNGLTIRPFAYACMLNLCFTDFSTSCTANLCNMNHHDGCFWFFCGIKDKEV